MNAPFVVYYSLTSGKVDVRTGWDPLSSRMSAFNHVANHRLTPKKTPAKLGRDETSLRFSLNRIIGTTAVSASAVGFLPGVDLIATCAGAAAVLSQFNTHLNVTQRIFRAGPTATAVNASSPFYNSGTSFGSRDSARYVFRDPDQ